MKVDTVLYRNELKFIHVGSKPNLSGSMNAIPAFTLSPENFLQSHWPRTMLF